MSAAASLVTVLERICAPERVVTGADAMAGYRSDSLTRHRGSPRAVIFPESADEVREVVNACHQAGVPWVGRGAGTGLSGGATAVDDGVVIVLSRMRQVLEVDLANQRVTVEPGVTTAAVSDTVAPTHFYPPDPSSRAVCTIGGNLAENAGGAHCLEYGFTANYVTGVELVLPDGGSLRLGGKELDHPGLDLLGVLVGSEGTLGIVTAVTLRVVPVPEATRTLIAYFDAADQAGAAVSDVVAAGVVPGAMELMDQLTLQAVEAATAAGYRVDCGAALIVELDGPAAECDARLPAVVSALEDNGAVALRVARDETERQLLWAARRTAFAARSALAPNCYLHDGVVPRTRLAEVLRRTEELARQADLRVATVAHAGDGNLHPLVLYDADRPGEAERAEDLATSITRACLELGGSLTGEHGIGLDKRDHMGWTFSGADLDVFGRLRCAFDPAQLANPGKVLPSPRLCGEAPGPFRRHPLEAASVADRL
ncbi:MAG TPA: FAD-linked oxidase C-terminal domain-containing protein [Acidimicrobiales bacterium]|nr:FAD-linked oxidase C-terminal domain-containing protein [Acidimicrobiales bacterium]